MAYSEADYEAYWRQHEEILRLVREGFYTVLEGQHLVEELGDWYGMNE